MRDLRHTLSAILLVASALCLSAKSLTLPVGPFRVNHEAYPVVLHLDDYPEFSILDRANLAVFIGGKQVPSQLDDLNADGIIDELSFLVDIRAGQTLRFKLRPVCKHKTFEPRVHAEMYLKSKDSLPGYSFCEAEGKQFYITPVQEQTFYPGEDSYHSMHHHGVAFESELMAYRIYFDKKQTIDVYAKRTPRLEIDACKWYPTDQQLANHFGDDVLRVSGCIGVGTCKPSNGVKMLHFDSVQSRTQRILAAGPIRTVCEVEATGWQPQDGSAPLSVITRYTLYAGHRDVLVEVFASHPVENLVTGVMQVGPAPCYLSEPSIAASWGTAWPVNDTVKYAKETVGLAVYVPELDYKANLQDARNNLILLQACTYARYYFTVVSLKEDNPPASSAQSFFDYVRSWADALKDYE